MPLYAHVLIEHGQTRYKPGDQLPDYLPGLDELVAAGSAGDQPPTRVLEVDAAGNVVAERHADGAVVDLNHVKRFDGDFTDTDIDDPDVATPLAGVHRSGAEHFSQDPAVYDTAKGDA